MKKAFLSLVLLFISLNFFAQASFTATGIAVQGIARNASNTAYQNENISLDFEFYYLDESNAENLIGSKISKQVVTDNFGVFSTIIDPTSANNAVFANQKVWLRIINNEDSRTIQESQLMHVPYAISANNGVPIGTIMPYLGTIAPTGWLMCDGSTIPDGALKEMLDSQNLQSATTPDLRGMFLRGTAGTGNHVGPDLGKTQEEMVKVPSKSVNITADDPYSGTSDEYWVNYEATQESINVGNYYEKGIVLGKVVGSNKVRLRANIPSHGGVETRPRNYGVNYIIKL